LGVKGVKGVRGVKDDSFASGFSFITKTVKTHDCAACSVSIYLLASAKALFKQA